MNTARLALAVLLAIEAAIFHAAHASLPALLGFAALCLAVPALSIGRRGGRAGVLLAGGLAGWMLWAPGSGHQDLLPAVIAGVHLWAWATACRLHATSPAEPGGRAEGRTAASAGPEGRPGALNAAFFATLALAHHLFSGAPGLAPIVSVMAGFGVIGLGLLFWETGWFSSRRPLDDPAPPGPADRWLRAALLVLVFLALALVGLGTFTVATDPVARLADAARQRLFPPPLEEPSPAAAAPAGYDPEGGTLGVRERHRLPERADLRLGEAPEAYLGFADDDRLGMLLAGPVYLRRYALDDFADDQWFPRTTGRWLEDGSDGRLDGWVRLEADPPSADTEPVTTVPYTVYLPAHLGDALPVLPGLRAVQVPGLFEHATDWYRSDITGPVRYAAESAPRRWEDLPTGAPLRRAEASHPSQLDLSGAGSAVRALMDTIVPGDESPLRARLESIRGYLRENYRYSLVMTNPEGLPPLENFLFSERAGYCDFFASAAVLMARQAGVPARMAYGHAGGRWSTRDRLLAFHGDDAHGWAEIHLQDHGWVVFETTPSGSGPARPPRAEDFPTPGFDEYAELYPEAFAPGLWSRLLAFLTSPWTVGALAAAALLVVALLFWRNPARDSGRRARREEERPEPVPAYLAAFRRLCERAGHPVDPGETLRESLAWLRAHGRPVEGLGPLRDYHYAVRYGAGRPEPERERQLARSVESLIAAMEPGSPAGPA